MKEKLKARIAELTNIIDQSATQHHTFVGRLQELKDWLNFIEKEEENKEVTAELV